MIREPEDFILIALSLVWICVSYYIASALGVGWFGRLHIAIATLIWTFLCYITWQMDYIRFLWPALFGLLSVCWWPALTLLRAPDAPTPWYDSFYGKASISIALTLIAYLYFIIKQYKKSHPKHNNS